MIAAWPCEIALVCLAPIGKRPVTFTFVVGEIVVHPPLHQLLSCQDYAGPALAVERPRGFSDSRALQSLADCPAGCSLFALQHECKELIGERRIVTERKRFEF